jgi:diguanylate cyclase (GGDEF)-like protein
LYDIPDMATEAPYGALPTSEAAAEMAATSVRRIRRSLIEGFVAAAVVGSAGLALTVATNGPGGSPVPAIPLMAGLGIVFASVAFVSIRRVGSVASRLVDQLASTLDAYDRARLDARIDPLTGLGNHRAFQEELVRQIAEYQRDPGPLALVLFDVDDLKRVNDEQGHAAGDELLVAIGRLMTATIRPSDRPFRIGGDEFALLMPGTTGESAFAVARRLLASATGGHPRLHGMPRFSFSAGIASYPQPSADTIHLTHHADAALYYAKRHGRTDIQLFDPDRHGTADDLRSTPELADAISAVVARRTLRPVYQPIVSLRTGMPIGYEGLVRPGRDSGFANAQALFTAAEVADRIVELDMAAIEAIAASLGPLLPGQYLGVNMSPRTLETEQFHVGLITAVLGRHGLAPGQIVLELTEREAIEDFGRLRRNVERVKAAGIRLAADDVGAGNAGLRLLSEIAFDIVKIDLSLVQRGVLQESSLAVLRALQEMASRWGASVVAEGVETPEQLVALHRLGVTAAQGFLLGRPADHPNPAPVDLQAIEQMSNLELDAIAV